MDPDSLQSANAPSGDGLKSGEQATSPVLMTVSEQGALHLDLVQIQSTLPCRSTIADDCLATRTDGENAPFEFTGCTSAVPTQWPRISVRESSSLITLDLISTFLPDVSHSQ